MINNFPSSKVKKKIDSTLIILELDLYTFHVKQIVFDQMCCLMVVKKVNMPISLYSYMLPQTMSDIGQWMYFL